MDSVKIDLNSIYHNFQYHHPMLDPDIIVPITKNKFQPYFFDDYPKIIVILEGSNITGYMLAYFSYIRKIFKSIRTFYPFVSSVNLNYGEIIRKISNSHMVNYVPLLDNPFMHLVPNSFTRVELQRIVSYDLKPDKKARNCVRKAIANNLETQILSGDQITKDDIRDFLLVAKESLNRRERTINVDNTLICKWYTTISSIPENKGVFVKVLDNSGKILGGNYVIISGKILYHYIAYNSIEGLKKEAGYLALDTIFKFARDNNLIVDFGLNPFEPFVEYKKHWGITRIEPAFNYIPIHYKIIFNLYKKLLKSTFIKKIIGFGNYGVNNDY